MEPRPRILTPALRATTLGLFAVACHSESSSVMLQPEHVPAPASNQLEPAPTTVLEDRGEPACPDDMVLASGEFCPVAEQRCLEHHPEYRADRSKSERCLRYAEPSICRSSERILMRYCVDRYEWPNRAGELPQTLTQWSEAAQLCASVGKRLCDEDEWLFACEGPEMLPYTGGYTRDPTACVIDRLFVQRQDSLSRWDACMQDAACRDQFSRLDQREPSGSFSRCVSPFGAFDMNGNVNEWVAIPGARYPERSGLKGGWWGPVRNRCRPTVRFHKEEDWGYETGFRCCKNSQP